MKRASFSGLVEDYLAMLRDSGFDTERPRWLLRDFARFTDRIGYCGPLTVELASRWAVGSSPGEPVRAERRLSVLRRFARHLRALDPATEIPPVGLLGHPTGRSQPHIYSDAELGALARMLVTTTPRGGMSLTAWAQAVGALRPRCRIAGQSADLDAHVTQTFAQLSARDRDFAWPLWR